MSFTGNNGTVGVNAHKHTNTAGDGSTLDQTSLLLNIPILALVS